MLRSALCKNGFTILAIVLFLLFVPHVSFSESMEKLCDCLEKAIERTMYIQSLPELEYLHTLDGKNVALNEFHTKCSKLFPKCCLFRKFYYWQKEIKEIISMSIHGPIKHTIRCYHNCLETYCSKKSDPQKTDGDVVEFYDGQGKFMGLSVYMGDGKYCALAYSGYGH